MQQAWTAIRWGGHAILLRIMTRLFRLCMQVLQGMLFVWGCSGPAAAAESEVTPVPVMPDMEASEGTPKRLASGHKAVANFAVRILRFMLRK